MMLMARLAVSWLLLAVLLAKGGCEEERKGGKEMWTGERELAGMALQRQTELAETSPSECWTRSWEGLTGGCGALEERGQQQLALGLTRCHLEEAGVAVDSLLPREEEIAGLSEEALRSALGRLALEGDGAAYRVYGEFFVTATSLCHLIEASRARADVSATVGGLLESTQRASAALDGFDRRAGEASERLRGHRQGFEALFAQLDWLHLRLAVFEGFLQALASYAALFHSFGFFLLVALFGLLAASTPRTAAARPWTWPALLLALVAELWTPQVLLEMLGGDADAAQAVVRRTLVCFTLLAVFVSACTYRDVEWENHLLLKRLLKEVKKTRIESYGKNE